MFGSLTIVFLMGYGLVEIPISFFRHASNKKRLMHYQSKVAEYDDQLKDKAKKAQTLIEIIKDVKVEAGLEECKQRLQKDVENFHNIIEQMDYFRLTFTPSMSDRAGREFAGVLDYNKLVKLRNRLLLNTTDVIRLISFRRESIESAILTQDIVNSQIQGNKRVQSYYLTGYQSVGDKNQ